MSVDFICGDYGTVGTISLGAVNIFLSLTSLVESELGGLESGLAPIASDEILINKDRFVKFADEFFNQAKYSGKYRYFVRWAEEIEGIYENITKTTPQRQMLGVEHFRPRRYY